MKLSTVSFLFLISICLNAEAKVVSYPLPACYEESSLYQVQADGSNVPVAFFSSIYNYAHFLFEGETKISIEVSEDIVSYHISPLSLDVKAEVKGNKLIFTTTNPAYLIIKINELPDLVLAGDPLETDIPLQSGQGIFNVLSSDYRADRTGTVITTRAIQKAIDDASAFEGGIVYVPSGVYLCGNLVLKSNVSVYLEAGAVIRCTGKKEDYETFYRKNSLQMDGTWFIYTEENATDIKLYGRGIIDGTGLSMRQNQHYLNNLLVPLQCENLLVDGLIFRDSGLWGIIVTRSNDVTLRNIKVFNENALAYENDAIDIQESQNVAVQRVIAIAEDDTYSTKTWTSHTDIAENWWGTPECLKNVCFEDCLGWSRCATFKIGFGVFQNQSDITFRDCVSYKSMRALAVNHRYGGHTVNGVLFENIDIEGFCPRVGRPSRWLDVSVKDGAIVKNVFFKNIRIRDFGKDVSLLRGTAKSTLDSISFVNIRIEGRKQKASILRDMNIMNHPYVTNIHVD